MRATGTTIESHQNPCSNSAIVVQDDVPPVIEQLSGACVRFVQQALAMPLDFTPETLPILDHYVRERGRDEREEISRLMAAPTTTTTSTVSSSSPAF
jgi:hypothetical protein